MTPSKQCSAPLPYRWAMLATLICMSGLATWGFVRELYGRDDGGDYEMPSKGIIEDLMEQFGYSFGELLLVIEGEDLFSSEAVAASRQLIADLEVTPGIGEVFSLDRVPREASLLNLRSVLPPAGASEDKFVQARELALAHPLIPGILSDTHGKVWLLPVGIDWAAGVDHPDMDFAAAAKETVTNADLPPDMRASLTGAMMLTWASSEAFEYEQWLFQSLAYLLVFLLASFLFRGVWAVVLSGGGPVIGVVWAFGIAKLFGLHLSSLTLILLPVMLMMIGFTDSVHLMVHLRKERSRGKSPAEATAASLRLLALPCVLTSLTTGLGFASLLTARSDLVRDFGAACALGVVCMLLAVLTFLPFGASSFVGKYIRERERSSFVDNTMPTAESFVRWVLKHARAITVAGCLIALIAGVYGADLETENRVSADIPQSSAAARALRVIDDAFGGSTPLVVEVVWDESLEGQWEPILSAVEAAQAVVQDGEHSRPTSPIALLDFLAPEGTQSEAMARFDFLPKALTQQLLNQESRVALIHLLMPDRGYRYFQPTFDRWRAELRQLQQAHPGISFELGGQAIDSGTIYQQFTEDLMHSLVLAAFIIFSVLTLAFRSIRLGLISIVPNALPLTGTAALLVAMDIPMAGATALIMALGIAVDDTIHFMTRYRKELAECQDVDEAIRRSTLGVGKALLMTTVVLVVGFAPLMASDFPRNGVFSGMICFSLALALLSDLLLLPAMLKWLGPDPPPVRPQ